MKKLSILILSLIALVSFNACNYDDDVVFVTQPDPEGVSFLNTFIDEYILVSNASSNIAERFIWNPVDFGVQTNISYDLQQSASEDFSSFEVVGTTTSTEMAVTIGQMLAFAEAAGLDNDPSTDDKPNTGMLYFRVRAYAGDGGSNATENISQPQALTVVLPEDTGSGSGVQISSWGVVGSGYNNWGAFEDAPFYTTDQANVLVAYVTLVDGEIKFREDNAWDNNFGDDGNDGTLDSGGANIPVTAGNYKITLDLNNNTYTIEEFSWGVVGSGYNDWGNAGPDAKFYYDYTTDTFKVGVKLVDGEIKFRFNNAWNSDFGDDGADGTLDAGGANIPVTAGHYSITLDLNNNTYTMEPAEIWGVVGSAYNDWGATDDFSLTQVNPGLWYGDIVTLSAGEMKFRVNNQWTTDFGDDGGDGTLDAGGANIVVDEAGSYRVVLDLNNNTYALNKVL